jgi:hypothetical protein
MLAVASHGWVYGLDLGHDWDATSANWAADLSSNRYQEAYLAAVGSEIYAGSYGYVWRIDAATGTVLRQLLLTSRVLLPGDYVTRVAATDSALYAGVHGYVNSVALLAPIATTSFGAAAVQWGDSSGDHLRVYYQDAQGALREQATDAGKGWYAGQFSVPSAAAGSGLAAVHWSDSSGDHLRIYYEDPADTLHEQATDPGKGWYAGGFSNASRG